MEIILQHYLVSAANPPFLIWSYKADHIARHTNVQPKNVPVHERSKDFHASLVHSFPHSKEAGAVGSTNWTLFASVV